jgi:hypothetical protein
MVSPTARRKHSETGAIETAGGDASRDGMFAGQGSKQSRYGGLGVAGNPNEFGEIIKLHEAENQVIVDYEVDARRPEEK